MIYARITVNKMRIEIALHKSVDPAYGDMRAGCACNNRDVMRQLNPYIEEVRFKLMECYRELQLAHKPLATLIICYQ